MERGFRVRPDEPRVDVGACVDQKSDGRRSVWKMPRPIGRDVQERPAHCVDLARARLAPNSCAGQSRVLTQQTLQSIDAPLMDRLNRRPSHGLVASNLHDVPP